MLLKSVVGTWNEIRCLRAFNEDERLSFFVHGSTIAYMARAPSARERLCIAIETLASASISIRVRHVSAPTA